MPTQGIYAVLHVESRVAYIGGSTNCGNRFAWHRCMLNHGRHTSRNLQHHWDETLAMGWLFAILEIVKGGRKQLLKREQWWVDTWEGFHGEVLNEKKIVNGIGFRFTEDTRSQMSRSARRASNTPAQRRMRSERAKRQHREGNFGRQTWRV